jgi:hypothetical protein
MVASIAEGLASDGLEPVDGDDEPVIGLVLARITDARGRTRGSFLRVEGNSEAGGIRASSPPHTDGKRDSQIADDTSPDLLTMFNGPGPPT